MNCWNNLIILSGDGLTGKNGEDIYIRVPLGTVVTERLSDSLQDFIVSEIRNFSSAGKISLILSLFNFNIFVCCVSNHDQLTIYY